MAFHVKSVASVVLFALQCHRASMRKQGSYVPVNLLHRLREFHTVSDKDNEWNWLSYTGEDVVKGLFSHATKPVTEIRIGCVLLGIYLVLAKMQPVYLQWLA
jgi:hypothetical protein